MIYLIFYSGRRASVIFVIRKVMPKITRSSIAILFYIVLPFYYFLLGNFFLLRMFIAISTVIS